MGVFACVCVCGVRGSQWVDVVDVGASVGEWVYGRARVCVCVCVCVCVRVYVCVRACKYAFFVPLLLIIA